MSVMRFNNGSFSGPVGYLKGKTDADGNPIVYGVMYEYTFSKDLSGNYLGTDYRRLSPQENEYYEIKWAQYTPAVREAYDTKASSAWFNLEEELRQ